MLRVLARLLGLVLAVAALMGFILFVLPDGNDYAKATLDKHHRLDSLPSPKLVFVGGSNLAYGLDSERVERAFGMPVVNMGMNAYFGLRFLLDEVIPSLKARDVLVLSLEAEMFRVQDQFNAADGRNTDLLMMVKTRPASLAYVPWPLRRRILEAIPEAVQLKTVRILGDLLHGGRAPKLLDKIESRAGFNAHGDLISHIGVEWSQPLDPGTNLVACPLDPRIPALLRESREQLEKRQVRLILLPAPMPRTYYQAQVAAVDAAARGNRRGRTRPTSRATGALRLPRILLLRRRPPLDWRVPSRANQPGHRRSPFGARCGHRFW